MIVLDTTVLVYAVGLDHALIDPCRRLVDAVRAGSVRASTTVEVIQEFAHVRTRRYGRASAIGLARDFAGVLSPLMVTEPDHLAWGLDLYERHQRLGAFDAVLAARSLDLGVDHLVSADRAFGQVEGLDHVVPDDAGVTRLLA